MVRLIAYDNNGSPTVLDVIGNENIALTLNIDDVRDIENKNSSYSKDFELPATKTNNKFFNHIYDLQVNSNYNPYISSRIELYIDAVLIFSGGMYLNEVIKKEEETYYNVTLFAEPIRFVDRISNSLLSDLDLTGLNHAYTYANIEASWGSTGVALDAGGNSTAIFYPLIDTGDVYSFNNNVHIELQKSYTPFIQVKYILDKIFEGAGFRYDSDFFNSTFFSKLYMDSNAGAVLANVDFEPANVTIDISQVQSQTLTTTLSDLQLDEEISDPDGLFDDVTYSFVATEANMFILAEGTLPLFGTVGEKAEVYKSVTIGGTTTDTYLSSHTIAQSPNSTNINDVGALEVFFTQQLINIGDSVKIKVKKAGLVGGSSIVVRSDSQTIFDYTQSPPASVGSIDFSMVFVALGSGTFSERFNIGRGSIKQIDFVKDIFKMFNLMVEPTENPTLLKIEPYEEYIETGVVHDWTKKVNIEEAKQEYIDIPSTLLLTYNNDENDLLLKQYREQIGIPYGSFKVYLNSEKGSPKEIKLNLFSATAFANEATGFASQIYQEDNDSFLGTAPLENKPRILVKPTSNVPISVLDLFAGTIDNEYYTATHYEDNLNNLTSTSQDLNFGFIAPIFCNIGYTTPVNNLFQKYWFRFLNNRYNEDAVIYKCKANLKHTDIANFSFADTVIVENVKYYVNKIEYNTDDNTLATVELLKQIF